MLPCQRYVNNPLLRLVSDVFVTTGGFDERHSNLAITASSAWTHEALRIMILVISQVWAPPEATQASAICNMIFLLLAESFPFKVRLCSTLYGIPLPVSGPALATFLT
jgi:hypothetical protein